MATNPKLIRDWIQFLKNKKIVAVQSDPNSGKLTYKRPVTSADVIQFLESTGQYDEETIHAAIESVMGQAPGTDVSADPAQQQPGPAAGQRPQQQQPQQQPSDAPQVGKKRFNNDDAEDIDFRDASNRPAPKQIGNTPQIGHDKPEEQEPEDNGDPKQLGWARKPKFKLRNVKEAFTDHSGDKVSEEQVEAIFNALASGAAQQKGGPQGDQEEEDPAAKKKRELAKIQEVISNSMSPGHRKAFYRALNSATVNESYVDKKEVAQIFGAAADKKNFLRQNKVSLDDLQKAWKAAGYPDDTDHIGNILYKQFGFNEGSIHKIFTQVLGDDYDDEDVNGMSNRRYNNGQKDTTVTPALQQLIDYVTKNDLTADVLKFMNDNFGDELNAEDEPDEPPTQKPGMFQRAKNLFKRKATTEDVRRIFTSILGEERDARQGLIKQLEHTQLGRTRK